MKRNNPGARAEVCALDSEPTELDLSKRNGDSDVDGPVRLNVPVVLVPVMKPANGAVAPNPPPLLMAPAPALEKPPRPEMFAAPDVAKLLVPKPETPAPALVKPKPGMLVVPDVAKLPVPKPETPEPAPEPAPAPAPAPAFTGQLAAKPLLLEVVVPKPGKLPVPEMVLRDSKPERFELRWILLTSVGPNLGAGTAAAALKYGTVSVLDAAMISG